MQQSSNYKEYIFSQKTPFFNPFSELVNDKELVVFGAQKETNTNIPDAVNLGFHKLYRPIGKSIFTKEIEEFLKYFSKLPTNNKTNTSENSSFFNPLVFLTPSHTTIVDNSVNFGNSKTVINNNNNKKEKKDDDEKRSDAEKVFYTLMTIALAGTSTYFITKQYLENTFWNDFLKDLKTCKDRLLEIRNTPLSYEVVASQEFQQIEYLVDTAQKNIDNIVWQNKKQTTAKVVGAGTLVATPFIYAFAPTLFTPFAPVACVLGAGAVCSYIYNYMTFDENSVKDVQELRPTAEQLLSK